MKKNLFIVDDDEVDRYLIKRIATKSSMDFRVWEFATGQAFVDAIESPSDELAGCLSDNDRSLMLVDINMPGMNGFELVNEIREAIQREVVTEKSIAILICSSSDHPQDQAAAEEDALIRGYVVKPPTSDRLEELVQKYCADGE
jgi:CheY-like chemotaxis protein